MAAVVSAALMGCTNKGGETQATDFVDNVKEALSNGGQIDLDALQWTREPKVYEAKADTIRIIC